MHGAEAAGGEEEETKEGEGTHAVSE
jgi:hypothetical protein